MAEISTFGRRSVVTLVAAEGDLPTRDGGGGAGRAEAATPADEKYTTVASIGRGGMGEVLLVEDRDLQRQVAMKVIRESMAGDAAHRLRFVAEAQATSQLEHPGIPPVHDIGMSPEGRVYFTMKLVRGRTLAEVLKDLLLGVRPVREEYSLHKLISILERIAEALHFAHEKGVIHRDLKPENIMLGDFGEVHVMDWGIAKISVREGSDTTTRDLPDFAIRRTPVTFGEYLEFLAAVDAGQGAEAAAARIPGTKGDGAYMVRRADGTYGINPALLGEGHGPDDHGDGPDRTHDLPVIGVSCRDAEAYCAWRAATSGREWRLPSEEEREKAARGVDGRRFPWGDLADPSLCKNRDSREGPCQPEPVGTFPTAVSIYGMVDAAGGVWDWTTSLWEPHIPVSEARTIRGGSWSSPIAFSRTTAGNRAEPDHRVPYVGFRPARSLPS